MYEEVDVVIPGGNYGWRKYEALNNLRPEDPEIPNHIPPGISLFARKY